MEKIAEKVRENTEIRRRELERLETATQEIRELREERAATKFAVEKALVNEAKNFRTSWEGSPYLGVSGDTNWQKESSAAG